MLFILGDSLGLEFKTTPSIILVRPTPFTMTEHHTRSKTTDRLEEAVLRLTQNQSTLSDTHHDFKLCLDAIQEQLNALQLQPPPTPLPPPPPPNLNHPRSHIKLEVPGFDGHDATG